MGEETAQAQGSASTIWLMVDHSLRAMAFADVADKLEKRGHKVEVVTMTEALGTMARDVFTGSAERVLRGLRVVLQGSPSDEDLVGAVRRDKPDVLVITNPRHTRALSVLEGLAKTSMLQVGVLPDYNLSQAWLKSGLEAFIVPHEEQAERLERATHLPGERIAIAGPAIEAGFARELDRGEIRREFGFSQSEKIVMVRAEALDVSTLEKVVFQAKLVEGQVRYIFHHNGDGTAASTLRRAASEYGLQAVMFGRVEELEKYLAMADMVLTVAHDPYMPEVAALGLPVMMVGEVQEAAEQAEFLERHHMGRLVTDVLRLGSELERFLRDDVLEKYKESSASIGLQGGSDEVADALLDLLERSKRWQATSSHTQGAPTANDQGGSKGEDGGASSPFENIGGGGGASSSSSPTSHQGNARGGYAGSSSASSSSSNAPTSTGYAGISRAEAKEQLAQLILSEREIERRLTDLQKEQERWRSRLDLARQWNEEDLASEAEGVLRGYLEEAKPLQQELDGIRNQKAKLKAAAQGGSQARGDQQAGGDADPERQNRLSQLEQRFRKMEEDRDLDDLKDRIGREFDD